MNKLTGVKTIIGLDMGKDIGVAIAHVELNTAVPCFVTRSLQEVASYIIEKKADLLVIGWPLLLNGKEGLQCMKTKQIIHKLLKLTGEMPYELQDERFSSSFYANMYNEDAHSAAWIVQCFLQTKKPRVTP